MGLYNFRLISKVPQIPPKEKYFSNTNAKVHLVSSCDSRSQTHLLLSPSLPLRDKIIEDLITAAKTYDGLQIDWELVSAQDADNYMEFLKILKSRLNGKTLSVAIPARIKTLSKDAYNYSNLAQIADRIVIMAFFNSEDSESFNTYPSTPNSTALIKYSTSL